MQLISAQTGNQPYLVTFATEREAAVQPASWMHCRRSCGLSLEPKATDRRETLTGEILAVVSGHSALMSQTSLRDLCVMAHRDKAARGFSAAIFKLTGF